MASVSVELSSLTVELNELRVVCIIVASLSCQSKALYCSKFSIRHVGIIENILNYWIDFND